MKTIALRVICCTILALLATALISCGSGQDRDGKRLDEYAVTVKMGGKLLKSYSMKDIEQMPYTSGSITCSGRNRIDFADHPRNISHEEHIYSFITCGLREGVSF